MKKLIFISILFFACGKMFAQSGYSITATNDATPIVLDRVCSHSSVWRNNGGRSYKNKRKRRSQLRDCWFIDRSCSHSWGLDPVHEF